MSASSTTYRNNWISWVHFVYTQSDISKESKKPFSMQTSSRVSQGERNADSTETRNIRAMCGRKSRKRLDVSICIALFILELLRNSLHWKRGTLPSEDIRRKRNYCPVKCQESGIFMIFITFVPIYGKYYNSEKYF